LISILVYLNAGCGKKQSEDLALKEQKNLII